jgi:predicted DNA-binding transcriptional regulator AlpA
VNERKHARLPYPPPWQDMAALCQHICVSTTTVDNWVAQGILPPPRKRGGKLMWKWSEVDEYLTNGRPGASPNSDAERIRDATRRAMLEVHPGRRK